MSDDEDGAGSAARVGPTEMFGPYELRELVGRGGMGEVWRAHDHRQGRDVALKRITTTAADDSQFRARFLREARLTAALDSLHVIPIHDFGEIDGRLYLVMRLVTGGDLATTLAASPDGLAPPRAVAVVEQVAEALDAAHARGLVHRDVKPANVLLAASRGQDFAYLVDFGIAKAADDTGLTGTGTEPGTVAYMAPEVFAGDGSTPRSDVYALGCVLYECLTGRRAFAEPSVPSLMHAHLYGPVPRTARPDLAGYDHVLARALAKNPNDRHPSTGDLAAHARSIPPPAPEPRTYVSGPVPPGPAPATQVPPTTPAPPRIEGGGPAPAPRRVRRWWPWAALAAVLLLAVGTVAAVTSWSSSEPSPRPSVATQPEPPRVATIAARPLPPNVNGLDVALSPDGSRAYVAVVGTEQAPSDRVEVIDLSAGRSVGSIRAGPNPQGVELSPDGATLYTTVQGTDVDQPDLVSIVDVATGQLTGSVPVGQRPYFAGLSRDGRTLWVPNLGYDDVPSNTVSVLDTGSRAVTRTVPTGPGPWEVVLTPDGRSAYVSNRGAFANTNNTVSAVDAEAAAVRATITVGANVTGLAISPDGQTLYAASAATSDGPLGSVSVIDVATDTLRTVIRGEAFAPIDVEVSPDGTRVLAVTTNTDEGLPSSVALIDTAGNTITATVPIADGAWRAVFTPDGRQAYVTTSSGLWVVDVP